MKTNNSQNKVKIVVQKENKKPPKTNKIHENENKNEITEKTEELYLKGEPHIDITESKEYAILTNEIYKEWSGMTAKQYKSFKGLRKESLRDNMSDVEVALADLGEIATREIAKKKNPKGLNENIDVARRGGKIAGNARKDLEQELGESVVTNANALNYQYVDEKEIEINNL